MNDQRLFSKLREIGALLTIKRDECILELRDKKIAVTQGGGKYSHLMQLKYLPGSDLLDETVNACRGVVFSYEPFRGWWPVCVTYGRFFEISMSNCDQLSEGWWAEEKSDGSLIQLWYDKVTDEWITSTTGSLFGQGEAQSRKTFSHLFWSILGEGRKNLNKLHIYAFELQTPEQRIVLEYPQPKLTLHLLRSSEYGFRHSIEELREQAELLGVEPVLIIPQFELSELAELRKEEGCEGWVLKDDQGNMVKIKTQWYFEHHHRLTGQTDYGIEYLVWSGEVDELVEICSVNQHYRELVDKTTQRRAALLGRLDLFYWRIAEFESARQRAAAVKTLKISSVERGLLFCMLNYNLTSIEALLRVLTQKSQEGALPKDLLKQLREIAL